MKSNLNKPKKSREKQATPEIPKTPEIQNPDPKPTAVESEFNQIVQESREALQSEPIKEPKKRGPYRKREQVETSPQNPQTSPQVQEPAKLNLAPHLVAPIQLLSKIPANNYRIKELALDQTEAEQVALALQGCIDAFVPDLNAMSPKTAAIVTLGLVASTIFITKYQIYSDAMEARTPKIERPHDPPKAENEVIPIKTSLGDAPEKIPGGITPQDYFKQK